MKGAVSVSWKIVRSLQ